MHNIKELRKNLKNFKKKLSYRNYDFDIQTFEKVDNDKRKLISEKEKLEQQKKILSKSKDKLNFEKSKKISEKISKLSKDQVDIGVTLISLFEAELIIYVSPRLILYFKLLFNSLSFLIFLTEYFFLISPFKSNSYTSGFCIKEFRIKGKINIIKKKAKFT